MMKIHAALCVISSFAAISVTETFAPDCYGVNAVSVRCLSKETLYRRDAFYVGGRYIQTALGNVTIDQIYVEKLSPPGRTLQPHPLVFFHGGGTSAVSWLNTPDNRKGWATYFVEKGYTVYLVDAYSGARSAANDFSQYSMNSGISAELAQAGFTASSIKHTQWPGSGIDNGDPTFDAFKKTLIPWTTSFVQQELAMRTSGCELLRLLGSPAFLISHSLGSFYPILLSNDCPHLVKGSINLEAATTPFWRYNVGSLGGVPQSPWGLTFSPLSYDPPARNASGAQTLPCSVPFCRTVCSEDTELVIQSIGNDTIEHRTCYRQAEPARRLPNVSSVPYLGITSEGSNHITFGHCIIDYLKQVGGRPGWIKLADIGIRGNGHFMHVELNNLQIASLVDDWIVKEVRLG